MDTGDFRAKQVEGDRIEFGYTGEHHGILVDTFELNGQTQYIYGTDVHVVFIDPSFNNGNHLLDGIVGTDANGNQVTAGVPVSFQQISTLNHTETDGVEVLYTYRQHPMHHGGLVTWMVGGRYIRFDDDFDVQGLGGNLAQSVWDTTARNRIYGPEVGVRWQKEFGRFGISSEGRFMAGVDSQNIRQNGEIASELFGTADNPSPLPTLLHATTFASAAELTTFCPVIEFRAEAHVQLTRLIQFKAGWTGIVMDGIARGADMVNYELNGITGQFMGINTGANSQPVFIQGLNVGFELNR
jgi:hypothetical protein